MRCGRCGSKAVIYLGYSHQALCPAHLEEYLIERVRRAVRGHLPPRGGLLLMAVSGGKDSAAAAGLLKALEAEASFKLGLVHLDLGVGEYSRRSREAAVKLSEALEAPLALISVEEAVGLSVVELARRSRRPTCSACGVVKRYLLNLAALKAGAFRLATGHNMDDVAAYAIKAFLTHEPSYAEKLAGHTETLDGLVGRLRPLIEVGEREALVYVLSKPLPFSHEECPYVNREGLEFKAKLFLADLESSRPGFKISFVRGLVRKASPKPLEEGLVKCESCGMPSSTRKCAFCRLVERALGSSWRPRSVEEAVEEAVKVFSPRHGSKS